MTEYHKQLNYRLAREPKQSCTQCWYTHQSAGTSCGKLVSLGSHLGVEPTHTCDEFKPNLKSTA